MSESDFEALFSVVKGLELDSPDLLAVVERLTELTGTKANGRTILETATIGEVARWLKAGSVHGTLVVATLRLIQNISLPEEGRDDVAFLFTEILCHMLWSDHSDPTVMELTLGVLQMLANDQVAQCLTEDAAALAAISSMFETATVDMQAEVAKLCLALCKVGKYLAAIVASPLVRVLARGAVSPDAKLQVPSAHALALVSEFWVSRVDRAAAAALVAGGIPEAMLHCVSSASRTRNVSRCMAAALNRVLTREDEATREVFLAPPTGPRHLLEGAHSDDPDVGEMLIPVVAALSASAGPCKMLYDAAGVLPMREAMASPNYGPETLVDAATALLYMGTLEDPINMTPYQQKAYDFILDQCLNGQGPARVHAITQLKAIAIDESRQGPLVNASFIPAVIAMVSDAYLRSSALAILERLSAQKRFYRALDKAKTKKVVKPFLKSTETSVYDNAAAILANMKASKS